MAKEPWGSNAWLGVGGTQGRPAYVAWRECGEDCTAYALFPPMPSAPALIWPGTELPPPLLLPGQAEQRWAAASAADCTRAGTEQSSRK